MTRSASSNFFTRAYNLARTSRLFEAPGVERVFLSSYFLYKRWYEDPFWALAKRSPELFLGGDTLDIGANIGYTACVFAAAASPGSKVHAFEPDQDSFLKLQQNIRRKRLTSRVNLYQSAVGRQEGTLEFWHNKEHSADHRVATEQFKDARTIDENITRVAVTTVDRFVASRNLQNIAFIKIDVQGYEPAVCEGMQETLEKFPKAVVAFEYAPESIRELGLDPRSLLESFRALGYSLYVLTRKATTPVRADGELEVALKPKGYVDILCSKSSLD
ncbi:MAG TPA: FkbM family methyltransferase [Candidatus Acidoferrum sp.]|nr:FkbM family methyltransferase [Candidatus Acidoferrum sp.]